MIAANDLDYSYFVCYGESSSEKRLYRFTPTSYDWSEALQTVLPPGLGGNVDAMAAATDASAQPGDPYLNVCWAEGLQTGVVTFWFAQSRDRGASFLAPVSVHSQQVFDMLTVAVATTVGWSGEDEVLLAAAPEDRPGSVPEMIAIYRSADQGLHWSAGTSVDPSAYAQREPSLAGFGNHVFMAYSRRADAAAQRDIYFVYSPDGGVTYSDPEPLTGGPADDFTPQIVVDHDGQYFHVFYLTGAVQGDESTLMVVSGLVESPWDIGEPEMVSDSGSVVNAGGYSVAVAPSGIGAVWTSRFPLGDTDIRFDASWRGNSSHLVRTFLPSRSEIGSCYPNPFNGVVIVPLHLRATQDVSLDLSDVLGRHVTTVFVGLMSPGIHQLSVDFGACPTGAYWLRMRGTSDPPQRLLLLR